MLQIRSNLRDNLLLTVREALPDDVDGILEFRRQLAVEGVVTSRPDELARREVVVRSIQSRHHLRLLAIFNGRCIGEIHLRRGVRFASAHVCTLTIAVARHVRGRGIGRHLLRAAIDAVSTHPRLQGVRKFELSTLATNVAAQALYESLGFRQEGARPMHVRRKVADLIEFEDVILFGLTHATENER